MKKFNMAATLASSATMSSDPLCAMSHNPHCILLFSGKRKSGKDYITDILHERLTPERSVVIKISGPIKSHWAKELNLNYKDLLSDGKYKEKYRMEMCKWGEDTRKKDYGYFCRAAIDMYNAQNKNIWIVSDIRRKSDIKWFSESYGTKCRTIRIKCNEEIRTKRGWIFTPGIDDSETECDLDDKNDWDLVITNETNSIDNIIETIYRVIE